MAELRKDITRTVKDKAEMYACKKIYGRKDIIIALLLLFAFIAL